MSYQVLARKWRPRAFKDMVGQTTILRILHNAIEQKRIHHAYLFTGTRGVGKTTLARIFAKCLNCETNITALPCGQCNICRAIDEGKFPDFYEVDAASRTGIEETKELLQNVLYPPGQGRFKVFLIDEVHMLSQHSFNALLKTLEEPPEHVKFLLATTDPKRLPVTILSRCLQFHLTRITVDEIQKYLQYICTEEKIHFEIEALQLLAKAADGSMRDALSLLDQAIAYGQQNISKQEVTAMLGCMDQKDILPLLNALSKRDGQTLLNIITELNEHAADFNQVLDMLIAAFHQLAIAQTVPTALTDQTLSSLINDFNPEDIQLYYQIALLGKRDLNLTPTPRLGFEMTLLRMLAFKLPDTTESVSTVSVIASEAKQSSDVKSSQEELDCLVAKNAPRNDERKADATTQENTPRHCEQSEAIQEWREIFPKLELSGMTYALAANCSLENLTDNQITLALSTQHEPMLNDKLKERMTEALERHFKRRMQLIIHLTTADLSTPLKQQQSQEKHDLEKARQVVMQNPQVKKLIDMYDATIVEIACK
jgi:DNA polymerase-3 subunit gamma/tau